MADLDGLVDIVGDTLEVFLTHTTAGHGRGTDTDTAWSQGRLISRDRVLVASDVDLLEDGFDTGTIETGWSEIQKDHMAVSAISHKLVVKLLKLGLHSFGVLDNLFLVFLESWSICLLQGNSQGGDCVVVGTTLVTREDREVNWVFEIIHDRLSRLVGASDTLSEEDHGTSGSTERLVGSGGDNISVLKWRWDNSGSNETRNMGHVDDKVSTNGVGDLAHSLVVDQTAVCGGTSHNGLWSVELGIGLKGVVVDDASLQVNTIWESFEVGRDSGDPVQCVSMSPSKL